MTSESTHAQSTPAPASYWNPNVEYHPVVLDAVPRRCGAVLDIGCGDGLLVRRLAPLARHVTGTDCSTDMVALARAQNVDLANADFVEGDFLTDAARDFPPAAYDMVTMVAVAHHLGTEVAMEAAAELLTPGGRLVIIGLAAPGSAVDWAALVAAQLAMPFHVRRHGGKDSPDGLPVTDPDLTWSQVRQAAYRRLPGCRFRRHLLWRYSVVWEKPR